MFSCSIADSGLSCEAQYMISKRTNLSMCWECKQDMVKHRHDANLECAMYLVDGHQEVS